MYITRFTYGSFQFTAKSPSVNGKQRNDKIISVLKELFDSLDSTIGLTTFFKNNKKTILVNKLHELCSLYSETNPLFHTKLGALLMLSNDLEVIKKHSLRCFSKFKRDLIKQKNLNSSWDGFRFEARIYSTLVKQGTTPFNRESPDIKVDWQDDSFFVECTESKVGINNQVNVQQKIKQAVFKKNKKVYANKNTALFINITNLLHNESGTHTDIYSLKEYISSYSTIKFGVIILLTYTFNPSLNRYEQIYASIPLPHCSQSLSQFIEHFYSTKQSIDVIRADISAYC